MIGMELRDKVNYAIGALYYLCNASTKEHFETRSDGYRFTSAKYQYQDQKSHLQNITAFAGGKRKSHHDANQAAIGVNPAYAGAYGATPPLSQIPYMGGAKSEAPAPPNNIMFIKKLPHETSSMMLQMLIGQHRGFKEVRMVEAIPGIDFIEYGDKMQATVAMHSLQGFKINPKSPMLITYAKK
ncbi:hypothetical protein L1987_57929 [Smallanthus sonchifolius]|uniref:Uncharacterized protein n=1 Tax=Smallanthus sonchifolius TaxID=185202 RepID=A0ACB9DEZ4_9ASTR|nr:hypothetical protein L1987_57929 [Smallanthus sonchifolius]